LKHERKSSTEKIDQSNIAIGSTATQVESVVLKSTSTMPEDLPIFYIFGMLSLDIDVSVR
jgi:hypothetical protein